MYKPGYAFIGFMSSEDIRYGGTEWNNLYDVDGDLYTTSSVVKANSYVRDEAQKYPVTKPIDLYPIYVKYNIETSTNVNLLNEELDINVPDNPTHILDDTEDFLRKVTLQADLDTYVQDGKEQKYSLKNMSVYKNGELVDTIDGNNGEFEYYIEPGDNYNFVANYEPYLVTYHTSEGEIDVQIKNDGEEFGHHSNPTYNIQNGEDVIFYGWTKSRPQTLEYHYFNTLSSFTNSGLETINEDMLVTETAELFPIYIKTNIINIINGN